MAQAAEGGAMKKEEILARSRENWGEADEREKLLATSGAMVGLMVVFAGAVALSLVKTWVLHVPANDLLALAFIGMGSANLYQYVHMRSSQHLTGAVLFFGGAALFAVSYVLALNGVEL